MSENLDELYQQVILDHAKAKKGSGVLAHADAEKHEHNPTCGDDVTVQLLMSADGDRVERLAWHGDGCSISTASASVLSELAEGVRREELTGMIDSFREVLRSRGTVEADEELLGDAVAFQGVAKFVMRVKCAMLPWVATEGALRLIAR